MTHFNLRYLFFKCLQKVALPSHIQKMKGYRRAKECCSFNRVMSPEKSDTNLRASMGPEVIVLSGKGHKNLGRGFIKLKPSLPHCSTGHLQV